MNVTITAGDGASPVILHVPHSSTHIPADVRSDLLLDDAALSLELLRMTDAYTDEVAHHAARQAALSPSSFVNRLSRLVIDPERFTDGSEEMDQVGMGAVYVRTSQGVPLRHPDAARDAVLIDRYFTPYAEALADLTADVLARHGRAVIIHVHSYPRTALPYEVHGELRRPEICLGSDPVHTTRELLSTATSCCAPLGTVLVNEPFIGTYVPTRFYERDPRVTSIMVEIRRDLITADPHGHADPHGIARVGDALAGLIDAATSLR